MRSTRVAGTVAALAALALAAPAGANVGDITNLTFDDTIQTDGQFALVTGEITCATSLEYGLIVKIAQPPSAVAPNNFSNGRAEGVGAYGPEQPSGDAGVVDDSPCGQQASEYDVVVTRNEGSQQFDSSDFGVRVEAGTTADSGDRGPGPFVGDLEQVTGTADSVFTGNGDNGGNGGGDPQPPAGNCADADAVVLEGAQLLCLYQGENAENATAEGDCPDALFASGPTPLGGVCIFLPPEGSS